MSVSKKSRVYETQGESYDRFPMAGESWQPAEGIRGLFVRKTASVVEYLRFVFDSASYVAFDSNDPSKRNVCVVWQNDGGGDYHCIEGMQGKQILALSYSWEERLRLVPEPHCDWVVEVPETMTYSDRLNFLLNPEQAQLISGRLTAEFSPQDI